MTIFFVGEFTSAERYTCIKDVSIHHEKLQFLFANEISPFNDFKSVVQASYLGQMISVGINVISRSLLSNDRKYDTTDNQNQA